MAETSRWGTSRWGLRRWAQATTLAPPLSTQRGVLTARTATSKIQPRKPR